MLVRYTLASRLVSMYLLMFEDKNIFVIRLISLLKCYVTKIYVNFAGSCQPRFISFFFQQRFEKMAIFYNKEIFMFVV